MDHLSGELWPGNHSYHRWMRMKVEKRDGNVCVKGGGVELRRIQGRRKMAVLNKMFGVGIIENEKWLLSIHCSLSPSLYPASK